MSARADKFATMLERMTPRWLVKDLRFHSMSLEPDPQTGGCIVLFDRKGVRGGEAVCFGIDEVRSLIDGLTRWMEENGHPIGVEHLGAEMDAAPKDGGPHV